MEHLTALLMASLGVACICAGYRLFCGLPAMNAPGRPATRMAVILRNMVPGALLALLGTALLTTEARAMMPRRTAPVQHHEPAAEGTSWHPPVHTVGNHSA